MKKIFVFSLFSVIISSIFGVIPTGYYNTLEGKKTALLKTELNKILNKDTTHYLGYGSGAGKTWEGFNSTDQDPVTHAVIDMYSPNVRYFPNPNPTFVSFQQIIHIEHSLPKSWWGCDINHPDVAAKDLHHLYPADGPTNSSKNDNPLGVVTGTASLNNGVSKVGKAVYDGYVGTVFEPADQYKGDFARSYFYMAAAYEHYVNRWDTTKPENMMEHNTYPVFKPWAIKLLLQWHRQDPVSQKELTRTEIVYNFQTNRNPFIDHPELAEYIWGDKMDIPYRLDGNVNFPYLNTPNNEDNVDFGKVYFQQTASTSLSVKAKNLTGDLSLAISGTNASNFSVIKSTISKVDAEIGYGLTINYNAQTAGVQSAKLTISGGGITPININLKANCSTEFVALPATNITNKGFTAHWTASPGATGYSLNVFSLQNTAPFTPKTLVEEDFISLLPNNWTAEGYYDNTTYSNMRLGSPTSFGKLTLPPLDLSNSGATLLVRAKQYSTDAGSQVTALLNTLPLAVWTTGVNNTDFTIQLPQGSSNTSISLSAIAGKRVYIDYVKVVTYMPAQVPVSIANYPKSVSNLLSYAVDGLQSDSTYFYTIMPEGNSGILSNETTVHTALSTEIQTNDYHSITYYKHSGGIVIRNLGENYTIKVFDIMGKLGQNIQSNSADAKIDLHQKGVYLLQIQQQGICKTFKILY
jgi:hypothetical protein